MTKKEKAELLAEYHRRKTAGKLPANLYSPIPSRIRDECLKQYKTGIRPEGATVLEGYFKRNYKGDFHSGVLEMDRDRFKSTAALLKGRDFEPEEKNYELLAWLLGPERLPDGPILTDTPGDQGSFKKLNLYLKNKRALAIGTTIILSVITGALLLIKNTHSCMRWDGRQYQVAACTISNTGNTVYSIDSRKIERFKKVMRPDTVTAAAVGKLWYFKTNKQLELFTDSGMHPIWTNRKLKPLTHYMIIRYLTRDTVQGENRQPAISRAQ